MKFFYCTFLFLCIQQQIFAVTCKEIETYNKKEYFYEPNSYSSTFYLPMPCGLKMAFKKVIVSGRNFWGEPAKRPNTVVGNFAPKNEKIGMMERPTQAQINGSFFNEKESRKKGESIYSSLSFTFPSLK